MRRKVREHPANRADGILSIRSPSERSCGPAGSCRLVPTPSTSTEVQDASTGTGDCAATSAASAATTATSSASIAASGSPDPPGRSAPVHPRGPECVCDAHTITASTSRRSSTTARSAATSSTVAPTASNASHTTRVEPSSSTSSPASRSSCVPVLSAAPLAAYPASSPETDGVTTDAPTRSRRSGTAARDRGARQRLDERLGDRDRVR